MRKEGRRWVQTLKGAGDGIWQRLEHEVPLRVAAGVQPLADPALHDGTPAGEALRQALGDGELQPIYGTEVTRTPAPGARAGLHGRAGLRPGRAGRRRRSAGRCASWSSSSSPASPAALVALASRWVERFGLTLDVRTKAERGERLARGVRLGAPVKAQPLALPEAVDSHTALRQVLGNCLAQVLANASDIAHEADTAPEQLHQLRVGLRRLRTALRELGPLSAALRPEWGEALGQLFGRLGSARDRDALAQTLLPALRQAGATGLELPQHRGRAGGAGGAARDRDHAAVAAAAGLCRRRRRVPARPSPRPSGERLARLFKQVRRDASAVRHARRHGAAPPAQARQAAALPAASLRRAPFRAKRVKAFLKRLAPAQEALGAFNDVCVARALFEHAAPDDPMAMFALGWLAHERDDAIARCLRVLAPLRKARPFW